MWYSEIEYYSTDTANNLYVYAMIGSAQHSDHWIAYNYVAGQWIDASPDHPATVTQTGDQIIKLS